MGRKSLDPAIHEASGAYAKNPQRRPKEAPKFVPGAPDVPHDIVADEHAYWYWNWCCEVLSDSGILTKALLPFLVIQCKDWSQLMWLYEATKEGNVSTMTSKGSLATSPEASQLNQYANRFLKELSESGLTPASKSKIISSGKSRDEDPFAEMLQRRMGGPSKN